MTNFIKRIFCFFGLHAWWPYYDEWNDRFICVCVDCKKEDDFLDETIKEKRK